MTIDNHNIKYRLRKSLILILIFLIKSIRFLIIMYFIFTTIRSDSGNDVSIAEWRSCDSRSHVRSHPPTFRDDFLTTYALVSACHTLNSWFFTPSHLILFCKWKVSDQYVANKYVIVLLWS
jgi:hypothetical protein